MISVLGINFDDYLYDTIRPETQIMINKDIKEKIYYFKQKHNVDVRDIVKGVMGIPEYKCIGGVHCARVMLSLVDEYGVNNLIKKYNDEQLLEMCLNVTSTSTKTKMKEEILERMGGKNE